MAEVHNTSVEECVVEFTPDKASSAAYDESCPFIFQNSKCHVKVVWGWETSHDRSIKTDLIASPRLYQNFCATVTLRKGDKSIFYPRCKVTGNNGCFWKSSLQSISEKLKTVDRRDFIMKFCFQTEPQTEQKNSGHTIVQSSPCPDESSSLQRLSDDFAKLFDAMSQPDIELTSGDTVMKAHKFILLARWPYVRKLLQSSTKSRFDLPNIDPASLRQIIRYVYTGKIPNLSFELAKNIHKSRICDAGSLGELCVQFLQQHLTVHNACECLALVDDEDPFKETILSFMIEKEIPLNSELMKEFCYKNFDAAIVVYDKICRRLWPRN